GRTMAAVGRRGAWWPAAGRVWSRHVATTRSKLGVVARDAEFLDPATQRAGVESEDRGSAARAGDDPVGVPQDGEDVVALHGLKAWEGLARPLWGGGRDGAASGALRLGQFLGGGTLRRRGQEVGRDL